MSLDIVIIAVVARSGHPVAWHGPPGVGKTAVLPVLARALGYLPADDGGGFANRPGFVSRACGQCSAEDMAGLPVPSAGDCGLGRRFDDDFLLMARYPCLAVWDELNRGTMATMNAALRVINEGMAGSLSLHPDTVHVATCNPVSSAGTRELPEALANRFAHVVTWGVNAPAFIDYLRGGRGLAASIPALPDKATFQSRVPEARGIVAAFLESGAVNGEGNSLAHDEPKPDAIGWTVNDKGEKIQQPWGRAACGPWPSPRTWTNLSDGIAVLLAMGDIRGQYSEHLLALATAWVGEEAARKLSEFVDKTAIRGGAAVLDMGGGYNPPPSYGVLVAECYAAAAECYRRNTPDGYTKFLDICNDVLLPRNPEIVGLIIEHGMGGAGGRPMRPEAHGAYAAPKYARLRSNLGNTRVALAGVKAGGQ